MSVAVAFAKESSLADCRVYHSIGGRMFHPKLYILENDRERIVYIGSSNLTRGGLLDNVEANVRPNDRGNFPWRIRFLPLGGLTVGLPTREILETLRPGAPTNWFHGFIQQSHALSDEEFELLRGEFEAALRRQQFGGSL